jgi:hypothetical protein
VTGHRKEPRRNGFRLRTGAWKGACEAVEVDDHLASVDVLEDRGAPVIYGAELEAEELVGVMGLAFESGLEGLKAHLERVRRRPEEHRAGVPADRDYRARRVASSTPAFATQKGTR